MIELNKILTAQTNVSGLTGKTNPPQKKSSSKREYDDILAGTSTSASIKKFGITHYRYNDCKHSNLVSVGRCQVHRACADAFEEMQAAAKKEGLNIRIVSGYRSSEYQIEVFKRRFNGKYPTPEQMKSRLKFSAPSGYSEHHTGLAIDINQTEQKFENTAEYEWLQKNAAMYGFELSFPKDNAQGLGFEPWHWRYVGKTGEYKKIFEDARKNDPRFKDEY